MIGRLPVLAGLHTRRRLPGEVAGRVCDSGGRQLFGCRVIARHSRQGEVADLTAPCLTAPCVVCSLFRIGKNGAEGVIRGWCIGFASGEAASLAMHKVRGKGERVRGRGVNDVPKGWSRPNKKATTAMCGVPLPECFAVCQ